MPWHVWILVAAVVVALGFYGDRVQKQQSSDHSENRQQIADSVAAGVASAVDIDDITERVAARLEPGRAVNVDIVADKVRRMLENDIAHHLTDAIADMQDTIIGTVTDAVKASAVASLEVSEQSPNEFYESMTRVDGPQPAKRLYWDDTAEMWTDGINYYQNMD